MLFHVSIYYRTSLQIFLFYKFFCTNISQVELEILRDSSTIFRSSHWRCYIKKAILKHFVIFTRKHLCWDLFINEAAGHQACNYKKTYFEEHLQKAAFLQSVLSECFSVQNLARGTINDLLCERLLKLVKTEQFENTICLGISSAMFLQRLVGFYIKSLSIYLGNFNKNVD